MIGESLSGMRERACSQQRPNSVAENHLNVSALSTFSQQPRTSKPIHIMTLPTLLKNHLDHIISQEDEAAQREDNVWCLAISCDKSFYFRSIPRQ